VEKRHVVQAGNQDRNLTHLRESLIERAPLHPKQLHAMPVGRRGSGSRRELRPIAPADCWFASGLGPSRIWASDRTNTASLARVI